MDAELEFAIQPSTTGKLLFDQVRWDFRMAADRIRESEGKGTRGEDGGRKEEEWGG